MHITHCLGEELYLLPEKAIFWPAMHTLLLADAHFGKVSHFRKAGVPIPSSSYLKDFEILDALIARQKVQRILFLGDLFHSHLNKEWDCFAEWRANYKSLSLELIKGNHDIIHEKEFKLAGVVLHHEKLEDGPFCFVHEATREVNTNNKYMMSGHIHPAVKLTVFGRQSETVPCFYFGKTQAILPAFGNFTGLATIKPKKGDEIYVVASGCVLPVTH